MIARVMKHGTRTFRFFRWRDCIVASQKSGANQLLALLDDLVIVAVDGEAEIPISRGFSQNYGSVRALVLATIGADVDVIVASVSRCEA